MAATPEDVRLADQLPALERAHAERVQASKTAREEIEIRRALDSETLAKLEGQRIDAQNAIVRAAAAKRRILEDVPRSVLIALDRAQADVRGYQDEIRRLERRVRDAEEALDKVKKREATALERKPLEEQLVGAKKDLARGAERLAELEAAVRKAQREHDDAVTKIRKELLAREAPRKTKS